MSVTELMYTPVPRHNVLVRLDRKLQQHTLDRANNSRGIPRQLHPAHLRGIPELSGGHVPDVRSISTSC